MENKITPKQALEEVRAFIPNTRQDSIVVIEQALVEHEKQKQILEVLKNKTPYIPFIYSAKNVEDYNYRYVDLYFNVEYLTKEEFNLVKEWLK